jgi:hypothetical protein
MAKSRPQPTNYTTDALVELQQERQPFIRTIKKIYKLSPNLNPKWRSNMLKHYEKELVELIMLQAGVEFLSPEHKLELLKMR